MQDPLHSVRTGDKLYTFVLMFDKAIGSNKVYYFMVDPWTGKRIFPKMNTIIMNRLKGLMSYRVVAIHNYLYVIGGKRWDTSRNVATVWKYDTITGRWLKQSPMNTARSRFSVDVIDGRIYVAGGETVKGTVVDSVECYNPLTDKWLEVASLPQPSVDHASCVNGGKLFVSGGKRKLKQQRCSTIFWVYDPKINTWVDLKENANFVLPHEREKHNMVAIGKELFFVAGRRYDYDAYSSRDDTSVFSFDSRALRAATRGLLEWDTAHPNIFSARNTAGTVAIGKNIYVFGGKNQAKNQVVRSVEVYNTRRRKWREAFRLPEGNFMNVDCVLLDVPYSNKDFNFMDYFMYDKWLMW